MSFKRKQPKIMSWKHASIYQISVSSFFDDKSYSAKDKESIGMGTLSGIQKKLPYIKKLNVDYIWLTPFYKSPRKDFGYDISDYLSVDPRFGSLADFTKLVDEASKHQIKIMIDLAISHTSDQHEWFLESRQSKKNQKADWYVWADGKKKGQPPNNWISIFGGSAWQWDEGREQYYLHNFLSEQPDLNFYNEEVQKNLLSILDFWLKLGVRGIRLDTVNFYFHDEKLRNNPKRDTKKYPLLKSEKTNPYHSQRHLYDKSQKINIEFLQKLRKVADKYDDVLLMGELGDHEKGIELCAEYTRGKDRLHSCYGFEMLNEKFSAAWFREVITAFEKERSKTGGAELSWSFSNHDMVRAVSRFGQNEKGKISNRDGLAKMLLVMLSSFKGSFIVYQGEELALPEAVVPREQMQDPYGITFYPKFKGRDGCRTPMVWNKTKNAGFSNAKTTWLPIGKSPAMNHEKLAVSLQEKDKKSTLSFYRDFLQWRKDEKVMLYGKLEAIDFTNNCLMIKRKLVIADFIDNYLDFAQMTKKINPEKFEKGAKKIREASKKLVKESAKMNKQKKKMTSNFLSFGASKLEALADTFDQGPEALFRRSSKFVAEKFDDFNDCFEDITFVFNFNNSAIELKGQKKDELFHMSGANKKAMLNRSSDFSATLPADGEEVFLQGAKLKKDENKCSLTLKPYGFFVIADSHKETVK